MRVAAYQAPYREYPAMGGAELVVPYLERARAEGVELVCCPEALIGELANESDGDTPEAVALSIEHGELDKAIAPLLGWGMTIVVGFTERGRNGDLHNAAVVIADTAVAGIYRKAYPGNSICAAGTEPRIFHHAGVLFGVLICNDAHYIEPARILTAARELEQDFVVADVHADGPRGGMDGDFFGRANPAVTEQFVALWH